MDGDVTRAIVIGSSGGIGGAIVRELEGRRVEVFGLSRSGGGQPFDITDEVMVADAAARLGGRGPFSAIYVASGALHGDGFGPEKALRDLDADNLARLFAVNAIGPALVAKHFVPLLPKQGRCLFAALSARVGSIGDNRLGGWYGYRASKAALNMIVKTLSIEVARTRPEAICVGLHPGTVDTGLSRSFQKNVEPDRLFSPDEAAGHLLAVVERLSPAQSGRCFAWDGREIAP